MSDLYSQIKADIVSAMKEKKTEVLGALRTLDSSIKNVAINAGNKIPTNDQVITAVSKAVKQGTDSAEQFVKGLRQDLADSELFQVNLYKKYLPKQLNVDEITVIVKEAIAEAGATVQSDFGKVMKIIMPKVKGIADGKIVQEIVKKLLG